MRYQVPVQVLSTFSNAIGSELPGTLVVNEEQKMEQKVVTGVAIAANEAKVTLSKVADRPGVASVIFGSLARAGINVDMIVQTSSDDGKTTDVTFTVGRGDVDRARQVLETEQNHIGHADLLTDNTVVKISLVGVGMRSHPGVAATMFKTLAEKSINIQAIETSEISISVLIAEEYAELAMRALHTAFELDAA
jgi:aspartate kinase